MDTMVPQGILYRTGLYDVDHGYFKESCKELGYMVNTMGSLKGSCIELGYMVYTMVPQGILYRTGMMYTMVPSRNLV